MHVIDPLAETSNWYSPFTYRNNNPIRFIDPNGMETDSYGNDPDELVKSGWATRIQGPDIVTKNSGDIANPSGGDGDKKDGAKGDNKSENASAQTQTTSSDAAQDDAGPMIDAAGFKPTIIAGDGGKNKKGGGDGDKLRGGKQKDRDRDIKQYPIEFQRWYHREIKPDVHPGRNATPGELKEAYKDWLEQGSPGAQVVKAGFWTLVGCGAYEVVKWGVGVFFAPETGGTSLAGAAALP